jgi:hypothetical protein
VSGWVQVCKWTKIDSRFKNRPEVVTGSKMDLNWLRFKNVPKEILGSKKDLEKNEIVRNCKREGM